MTGHTGSEIQYCNGPLCDETGAACPFCGDTGTVTVDGEHCPCELVRARVLERALDLSATARTAAIIAVGEDGLRSFRKGLDEGYYALEQFPESSNLRTALRLSTPKEG